MNICIYFKKINTCIYSFYCPQKNNYKAFKLKSYGCISENYPGIFVYLNDI